MNKFSSKEDPNYVKVVQELQRIVHQVLYERGRKCAICSYCKVSNLIM
jgi:hypothetical protein